jgi:hypothetical protein
VFPTLALRVQFRLHPAAGCQLLVPGLANGLAGENAAAGEVGRHYRARSALSIEEASQETHVIAFPWSAVSADRRSAAMVRLEDEDEENDDQNQDQHAATEVHRDPRARLSGTERCLPPGRA